MLDPSLTVVPTSEQTVDNPFPGPKPSQRSSSEPSLGAQAQYSPTTSLVLSSHIVLLHAQSGSGKSSLLEAGLKPSLAQRNIPIAGSVRFIRTSTTDTGADNPFVDRVIRALEDNKQATGAPAR